MIWWEHGFDLWVRSHINSENLKICQDTSKGVLIEKKNDCYDLFYILTSLRCEKEWNMFITFM